MNVTCTGSGHKGWPEYAPYVGIIVTAAATHIPEALVGQLTPGGRLVIPIERPNFRQELMLVEKGQNEETQVNSILGVAFVPLLDECGNRNGATNGMSSTKRVRMSSMSLASLAMHAML